MARYKSRATRCGEAVEEVRKAVTLVEEVCDTIEEKAAAANVTHDQTLDNPHDFHFTEEQYKELGDKVSDAESKVADAGSEISGLYDEIDEWRSNMEEKFSQTDKYQRLEDCASQLDAAKDPLENADWPTLPVVSAPQDVWEGFASDLRQVIDDLTSACDEAEAAEFPGMYG